MNPIEFTSALLEERALAVLGTDRRRAETRYRQGKTVVRLDLIPSAVGRLCLLRSMI